MSLSPIFWVWCAWGYAGCGLFPSWRQGWRGWDLVLGSGLASFSILFLSALGLQLAGLHLSALAWMAASAGLSAAACLIPGRGPRMQPPPPQGPRLRTAETLLLSLAIAFALGVMCYRAIAQPLTGPDTIFRWDFLARQILRLGNMGFYPPVSPADFEHYMWADGIPPLVPLNYLWAYLGAGSASASGTAPVVLLVALLGFGLTGRLASRASGRAASLWSVALLSGSAINTWSVTMGQESGLTVVGLLSLAWALGGEEADWRLAGLAAGVTAISRDYAIAVIPVGALLLARSRRPLREVSAFAAVAACIAGPWYVRNWVRTGNPVYNVDVLGLFPVSAVHADMMRSYVARYGFGGHFSERLAELAPLLWPLGAALLLAPLAAIRFGPRPAPCVCVLAATWVLLWVGSVGYTAGGIGYSLRVLSPAIALLAVAGGPALVRAKRLTGVVLAAVLAALSAEASARALLMMRSPLEVPVSQWGRVGDRFSAANGGPLHDRAATLVGNHRVLVDDAYTHAYLVNRGVKAVPIWSPAMAYLWSPAEGARESVRRLHAGGIDYIWLTAAREPRQYFDRFRFFQEIDPLLVPVLAGDNWILFALR